MRFLLFSMIILTQCGWSTGWQSALTPNYIIYPGIAYTTNTTLSNSQSGNIIIFNGTANNTQFTLPTATIGLDFTIVADVAKYMRIVIQSSDTINIASTVQGQSVTNLGSAGIGDSIELVCMTANTWSIKNRVGTWATAP